MDLFLCREFSVNTEYRVCIKQTDLPLRDKNNCLSPHHYNNFSSEIYCVLTFCVLTQKWSIISNGSEVRKSDVSFKHFEYCKTFEGFEEVLSDQVIFKIGKR